VPHVSFKDCALTVKPSCSSFKSIVTVRVNEGAGTAENYPVIQPSLSWKIELVALQRAFAFTRSYILHMESCRNEDVVHKVEGLCEQGMMSVRPPFNIPEISQSHDENPARHLIFQWITAFSDLFALARSSLDIGQLAGSRWIGIEPWLVCALRLPKAERWYSPLSPSGDGGNV
jgi:hypothetical protein